MENQIPDTIRAMILRRCLFVSMLLLVLVCGIFVTYFALCSHRQVNHEIIRVAVNHRKLVDQFFQEKIAMLQFIGSIMDYESLILPGRLERVCALLQNSTRAFVDLGVFDDLGNHVAYAGPHDLAGKNYGKEIWFQMVKNRGIYISDAFPGFRGIPHFIVAVRRTEGPRTWFLRATVDAWFFSNLVESVRLGSTGEAYIVNRHGILQTHRRSGGQVMESDGDFKDCMKGNLSVSAFLAGGSWGSRYVYAGLPLEQTDWVLVVRQTLWDAYRVLAVSAAISILILIGGVILVAVLGFVLTSDMEIRP
ncbi:MAG: cache domain-containing protein [Pseudomonadota bacterium]